jgi:hypothetical protein
MQISGLPSISRITPSAAGADSSSVLSDINQIAQPGQPQPAQPDTMENSAPNNPQHADEGCFALIKSSLFKCWESVKTCYDMAKTWITTKLSSIFSKEND